MQIKEKRKWEKRFSHPNFFLYFHRFAKSQNILSWKQPIKITDSNSWRFPRYPRMHVKTPFPHPLSLFLLSFTSSGTLGTQIFWLQWQEASLWFSHITWHCFFRTHTSFFCIFSKTNFCSSNLTFCLVYLIFNILELLAPVPLWSHHSTLKSISSTFKSFSLGDLMQ